MKYPERKKMKYKNARKKVGSVQPHFSQNIEISIDDFSNNIAYEQYNKLRK